MFSCYRRDEAADPEVYLDAAAVVLACYSEEIINSVTHPATGLPGTLKWLPQIAEIREACDRREGEESRARERVSQEERQLRERAEYNAFIAAQPKVDLKAKYGEGWGLNSAPFAKRNRPDFVVPTDDKLREIYGTRERAA